MQGAHEAAALRSKDFAHEIHVPKGMEDGEKVKGREEGTEGKEGNEHELKVREVEVKAKRGEEHGAHMEPKNFNAGATHRTKLDLELGGDPVLSLAKLLVGHCEAVIVSANT